MRRGRWGHGLAAICVFLCVCVTFGAQADTGKRIEFRVTHSNPACQGPYDKTTYAITSGELYVAGRLIGHFLLRGQDFAPSLPSSVIDGKLKYDPVVRTETPALLGGPQSGV